VKPKCFHCSRKGEELCRYDAVLKRRGPGKKNKRKRGQDDEDSSGAEVSPSGASGRKRRLRIPPKPVITEEGVGVSRMKDEYRSQGDGMVGGEYLSSRFEVSTARG
jgi:hypothetical protein